MTTGDAADKLRAQRAEGAISDGWEHQAGGREGGMVVFMQGVILIILNRVTKRVVARHMTHSATGAKTSVEDRQKQRQMSLKLELKSRIEFITGARW